MGADLVQYCGVGFEVGMADGLVESNYLFHLGERLLEIAPSSKDHCNVEPSDSFAGAVADLLLDGEGLVVVVERSLAVPEVVVHAADVVEGGGFA